MLGADFRRISSKLTRDNGKDSLQLFRTWRLSVEARLARHEPIRVEGGHASIEISYSITGIDPNR